MGLTYTGDDLTESAGAAISFAESKKSVTVMKKSFYGYGRMGLYDYERW